MHIMHLISASHGWWDYESCGVIHALLCVTQTNRTYVYVSRPPGIYKTGFWRNHSGFGCIFSLVAIMQRCEAKVHASTLISKSITTHGI